MSGPIDLDALGTADMESRLESPAFGGGSMNSVPRVSVEEHSDLAGRSYLDHIAT
jgi:hypothetical protein